MKTRKSCQLLQAFLVFLCVVALGSSCSSKSSSASTAIADGNGLVASVGSEKGSNKVEVFQAGEISPEETEVRLWMCDETAKFVFDDERCDSSYDMKNRQTIQDTIAERFQNYVITKITRGREDSGIKVRTVYYVALKKK